MTTTAQTLDLNPPRSGREMIGRYSWLLRLADKVRADHAGTAGEYIAYCGLSMGFLDRAGVSKETFDDLVSQGATDAQLQKYFDRHVDDAHREDANHYVLVEQKAHLDKQDFEEGRSH
jgi:hypothetical protein